jgi:hypothetical protein
MHGRPGDHYYYVFGPDEAEVIKRKLERGELDFAAVCALIDERSVTDARLSTRAWDQADEGEVIGDPRN